MQFLRERLRTIIISLLVIVLLAVAQVIGILGPIERLVAVILEPMQTTLYRFGDGIRPLYSANDESLVKENSSLKEQLSISTQRSDELATQIQQYSEYENQLAFAQQREYALVPAKITSRIGQGISTPTITVNLGKSDDVQVGYPVVYNDGTMIGIIDSVTDTQAQVALLTSNLVTVQAAVQNDGNAQGIVQGSFGTSLELNLILKDELVEEGNPVITNGKDRFIPRGLFVGIVESIEDEPSELFKSAKIIQSVKFDSNSIVSVIVPN